MDVSELLGKALREARAVQFEGVSGGPVHKARSQEFIKALTSQFAALYANDPSVRVLCRYNNKNRTEFGLNELLHDVCVCQVGQVPSAVHKTALAYIRNVLWQVESEFYKYSRETLKDFNKLVCGSAERKLFIGSQVGDNEGFIDVLLPAARACSGHVCVALLPHPCDWAGPGCRIYLWELKNGAWSKLPTTGPIW